MTSIRRITVKLIYGHRFRCPHCARLCLHPPYMIEYYMIGYGYCDLCGRWTPIEGGDKLGIVRGDRQGERYTEVYGKKEQGRESPGGAAYQ